MTTQANKTYTDKLREAAPLTPAGLAAYTRMGRPAIVAELLAETDNLPADALARLAALAAFVASETKKGN